MTSARAAIDSKLRVGGIVAAGGASLAVYIALAFIGDLRAHLGAYLGAHALLFAIYVAVVYRIAARSPVPPERSPIGPGAEAHSRWRAGLAAGFHARPGLWIALFAVAFRATLLFQPASLSDDIHRYVWDGRVQTTGVNPYSYPPDAPELRTLRDAGWEKINHPELRTIYPPLMEAIFFYAAEAGLREQGFKILFSVFDLAVALALAGMLQRTGRSGLLATVYAWNPLVIVETASSGHCDPVGLVLLVTAAAMAIDDRRAASISAYAVSVIARLLPLAFLPIFVRRFRARHLLLGAGIMVAAYLPYSGARGRIFSSLGIYAKNWDYNSIVFPALRSVLAAIVPVEPLNDLVTWIRSAMGDPAWSENLHHVVWPASLARAILAVALLAGIIAISFRVMEIERELFYATALLLVLTPTLHPWYLIWILPFAATVGSAPCVLFTGLAPLAYLSSRAPDGRCPAWVLAVEWGAPVLLALILRLRGPRA